MNVRALPIAIPPDDAHLERAMTDAQGLAGVATCVAWLKQYGRDPAEVQRVRLAMEWLIRRLEPASTMIEEELSGRIIWATHLHRLDGSLQWPMLYVVAARWWLGEPAAAVEQSKRITDLKRLEVCGLDARLVLLDCWTLAGMTEQSQLLLEQLRLVPEAAREIEQRRRLARARRAAGNGSATQHVAAVVASLLR